MITNVLLFILGLILLIKGASYFVRYSSEIAKRLGVSEFIIGLTLVAIGTSVPELSASIAASLKNVSGLIIGNVVGSNIANICLIIGITSAITTIKTDENMLKRDGYIMLFASILFFIFAHNQIISRIEAGVFLALYIAYVIFLVETGNKTKKKYHFREFFQFFYKFRYITTIRSKIFKNFNNKIKKRQTIKELFYSALVKDILLIILSLAAIIAGANYLVEQSIFFANFFKIPPALIGLTIIAIGTSLPELSVAITAARKGYNNIVIGNILGSNTANILLVLGVSGLIQPLSISKITINYTIPFMLAISLFFLFFIRNDWKIKRWEGMLLLVSYVIFIMLLFSGTLY